MTLIITELRRFGYEFGIAMAADTAITVTCRAVDGLIEERAFFGLTKLLPVQKLNAGISYWGWTKMPSSSKCGVWMDRWLNYFLVTHYGDYDTISDLAHLLEKELQGQIPKLTDQELEIGVSDNMGGIHLAGLVEHDKQKVPCFWHIHNGKSQVFGDKIDPHIVNANYDCPPEKFLQWTRKGEPYQTRNGDYVPYARFFDNYLRDYLEKLKSQEGIHVPLPKTAFAADFLRTQIKFISGLYAVGGTIDERNVSLIKRLARGIGGNVTTLVITNENELPDYKEF